MDVFSRQLAYENTFFELPHIGWTGHRIRRVQPVSRCTILTFRATTAMQPRPYQQHDILYIYKSV